MAVTVTEEEVDTLDSDHLQMEFARNIQNRFCSVDPDDLDERLRILSEVFKEHGLTFNTLHGDSSLFNYDNVTTIGRFPTLVYGVWHPVKTTGSPVTDYC